MTENVRFEFLVAMMNKGFIVTNGDVILGGCYAFMMLLGDTIVHGGTGQSITFTFQFNMITLSRTY